jgi:hypothetical protein
MLALRNYHVGDEKNEKLKKFAVDKLTNFFELFIHLREPVRQSSIRAVGAAKLRSCDTYFEAEPTRLEVIFSYCSSYR